MSFVMKQDLLLIQEVNLLRSHQSLCLIAENTDGQPPRLAGALALIHTQLGDIKCQLAELKNGYTELKNGHTGTQS